MLPFLDGGGDCRGGGERLGDVAPTKLALQLELKADGLSNLLAQALVSQLPNFVFQPADIQSADLVAQRDRVDSQTSRSCWDQDLIGIDSTRIGLTRGQRDSIDHRQQLVDPLPADHQDRAFARLFRPSGGIE